MSSTPSPKTSFWTKWWVIRFHMTSPMLPHFVGWKKQVSQNTTICEGCSCCSWVNPRDIRPRLKAVRSTLEQPKHLLPSGLIWYLKRAEEMNHKTRWRPSNLLARNVFIQKAYEAPHQFYASESWIINQYGEELNQNFHEKKMGLGSLTQLAKVRWDFVRVGISSAKLVTNLLLQQKFEACNFPWKNSLDSPRMKIHWIQKWIENHISYIWWYKFLSQPHILFRNVPKLLGEIHEMDIHYYITYNVYVDTHIYKHKHNLYTNIYYRLDTL